MTTAPLSACGRNPSVGWDVCVWRSDGQMRVWGWRVSLQSPLVSLPPCPCQEPEHTMLLHYYESDLCGGCVSAVIWFCCLLA